MVRDERRQRGLPERLATTITRFTGGSAAFLIALGIIVAWFVTGPLFHYSDTWPSRKPTSATGSSSPA